MLRAAGPLLVLLVAAGSFPGTNAQPNVLLVTIDTMRADRLGRPGVTPSLDRLAARGTTFSRAYAHAPTTLASHASILTGLLPPTHGVRNNGGFRLDASSLTLAEVLRGAGFATGAFVSAFVLDSRYGLAEGFDVYDDRAPAPPRAGTGGAFRFTERRAPDTLAPAAAWIARQNGPWFAWVHLFDPHAPYEAPRGGARGRSGAPDHVTAYDDEVGAVDRALARFFTDVGRVLDHTIVVVTADHGESLGEHGESTHGLFAYDATLRVPLIVAGPGITARVAREPVAHIDVMPTLLELTGLKAVVDGRSLVDALTGGALPDRPVYFEALDASLTRGWAPLTGVIAGGWKYIDLPIAELYHLDADSGELANRAETDAARVRQMRALVQRLGAATSASPRSTTALADSAALARLQSLGYLSGASDRAPGWRREDDPKQLLALHARFQRAADLAPRTPDAALRELRAIVDARPDFTSAYEAMATLLIETGRASEAVSLLSGAHTRGLTHPALTERLGAAHLAAGDARRAVSVLERLASGGAPTIELLHTFARALITAGDLARARETLTAVLRIDPTAPEALTNLGTLELQRGDMAAARRAFERALDTDDSSAAAWKGLGASLETTDAAGARRAWERALGIVPDDHALLARLAFLIARSNLAQARPYLERLIREAPDARFAADKRRARALLAELAGKPR